jgi:hypothetical protein
MPGIQQLGPRGPALRDASAQRGGAFDRPSALRPPLGPGPQERDGVAVDLKPDRRVHLADGLQGDRGQRALVGSIPMVFTSHFLSQVMESAPRRAT